MQEAGASQRAGISFLQRALPYDRFREVGERRLRDLDADQRSRSYGIAARAATKWTCSRRRKSPTLKPAGSAALANAIGPGRSARCSEPAIYSRAPALGARPLRLDCGMGWHMGYPKRGRFPLRLHGPPWP